MNSKRKLAATMALLCLSIFAGRSFASFYVLVDLGGGSITSSDGRGLNSAGQCVGFFSTGSDDRAFRTSSLRPINTQSDDLGTFGGSYAQAFGINAIGQAAGLAGKNGISVYRAFRTKPNQPINPQTDNLGLIA